MWTHLTSSVFQPQKEAFLEEWRQFLFSDVQCACMLSCFSSVQLLATLWTAACQAPLSTGFARQEEWSGLPPLGYSLHPGIEPASLTSPALAARFFTASTTWEAPGVQQSDSYIHTYIYVYIDMSFSDFFHYRLLHDIECSSLCYIIGPLFVYLFYI